jgi:hypothetical protein
MRKELAVCNFNDGELLDIGYFSLKSNGLLWKYYYNKINETQQPSTKTKPNQTSIEQTLLMKFSP